jgi:hypothetical protein
MAVCILVMQRPGVLILKNLSNKSPLSKKKKPKSFHFGNFWIKMPGFMEVVNEAWNDDSNHSEPCQHLFHKLKLAGKKLRIWSKGLFSKS